MSKGNRVLLIVVVVIAAGIVAWSCSNPPAPTITQPQPTTTDQSQSNSPAPTPTAPAQPVMEAGFEYTLDEGFTSFDTRAALNLFIHAVQVGDKTGLMDLAMTNGAWLPPGTVALAINTAGRDVEVRIVAMGHGDTPGLAPEALVDVTGSARWIPNGAIKAHADCSHKNPYGDKEPNCT